MKKQNRGISLISLIITIIVIIILAAIVIFSGMGTPEKAQLAEGIQDNTVTTIKNNLKIGDYVLYEGDTNNSYTLDSSLTGFASENGKELKPETTTWRVWDKKADGTIIIMPTSSVNTFSLCGAIGFVNSVDVIENICDIYANETYGVTANDIRSLKIEDLEDEKVSSNMKTARDNYDGDGSFPQYGKTNVDKYGGNGYTEGTFYIKKDGVTIIKEPNVASSTNPIILTQTSYENTSPVWNKYNESEKDTYGTLLGRTYGWLASPRVGLSSSWADFFVPIANQKKIETNNLCSSDSNYSWGESLGVRPLVSLSPTLQIDTSDTTRDGSTSKKAWQLIKSN